MYLSAPEYPTPLAKPFISKTFTDSKLEILPLTLTGQQQGFHAFWRFWKYEKIKLSVSRLRKVLKIAVL